MIFNNQIAGLDEAGRGPWAGPICIAIVLLTELVDELNDSKKLTEKSRQALFDKIILADSKTGIGWSSAAEIDELGLTIASELAAKRAYEDSALGHETKLIIDGNYNYLKDHPNIETIIKADGKIASVAAASIIAKVSRDNYMKKLAVEHPDYSFEKHKGYGTKVHIEALSKLGTCSEHRLSFKPVSKF